MSGLPGAAPSNDDDNAVGMDTLLARLRQHSRPVAAADSSYHYFSEHSNLYSQPHPQQSPSELFQPTSSKAPDKSLSSSSSQNVTLLSSQDTSQSIPTSGIAPNVDRTSSLLNLLKFSSQPSATPSVFASNTSTNMPPPLSRQASGSHTGSDCRTQIHSSQSRQESDLLAALIGSAQTKSVPKTTSPKLTTTVATMKTNLSQSMVSTSTDTQAYLLQLLNQPKIESSNHQLLRPVIKAQTPLTNERPQGEPVEAPAPTIGENSQKTTKVNPEDSEPLSSSAQERSKEVSSAKSSSGIFTYVNPFEGLAASSPRNRGKDNDKHAASGNPTVQILKNTRKDNSEKKTSPASSSSKSQSDQKNNGGGSKELNGTVRSAAHKQTKLEASASADIPKQTQAIQEPGAGAHVGKAVNGTSAKPKKDVSTVEIVKELREMVSAESERDLVPVENSDVVRDQSDAAHSQVADDWENADADNSTKEKEDGIVKVYNFPMRPWTSITIKPTDHDRPFFRKKAVLDIARLKKDFDQIDRTLVTASSKFIVYGMSKNGGIRIIRQDDGVDAKLFNETQDRIFNVITSSSPSEQKEAVIGTGISGSVYWVLIKDGEGDRIEETHPATYGFVIPPFPAPDSEILGCATKTRARKSSNHPDFFAVARGKFINIVLPQVILQKNLIKDEEKRLVDLDRYLNLHSLKINTIKACKDFTFSEDDTTIVSLNKSGQIKFWDIRNLIRPAVLNASTPQSCEIHEPIVTFDITPTSEKSSPSSVLFVDKLRPYQRGGALRYLIIGVKQNHTLQLWDITLEKPVQVIHLPHSNDSDGVCSVVYHAATGMIVVGHPTRNSIYFLHFSAPKYNLPKSLSQADYIANVAASSPSLPKPDATAVISGIREYSLDNKGSLRSVDILQTPNSASSPDSGSLFELYCMHSKGVTCLDIHAKDLGWDSEHKVVHPVLAEDLDMITFETLKETYVTPEPEDETVPNHLLWIPLPTQGQKDAEKPKYNSAKAHHGESSNFNNARYDERVEKKEHSSSNWGPTVPAISEKIEKKKRRKGTADTRGPSPSHTSFKMPVIDPSSNVRNLNLNRSHTNTATPDTVNHSSNTPSVNETDIKNLEKSLVNSFQRMLQEFKTDTQVQNANVTEKQELMFQTISSTMTDGMEAKLTSIIKRSIESDVIPVVSDITSRALHDQMSSNFNNLAGHMTREIQRSLPEMVSQVLGQPQFLNRVSESLAAPVAFNVLKEFNEFVASNIMPVVSDMISQNTLKISTEIQRRTAEHYNLLEQKHLSDSIKIAQLTQMVTGLAENISSMSERLSSMAASQAEIHGQYLKLQQQQQQQQQQQDAAQDRAQYARAAEISSNQPPASRPASVLTGTVLKNREDDEYDKMLASISRAMNAGDYENAVIQWLQTGREQEFFVNYFAKFSPDFVRELSPLLLLSLGATISVEFEGVVNNDFLNQRISWLEIILSTFQAHISAGSMDDQVRNLSPKIIGIYRQRFENIFMRISQSSTHEPILKRLSLLVSAADRIVETAQVDKRIHDYASGVVGGNSGGSSHVDSGASHRLYI